MATMNGEDIIYPRWRQTVATPFWAHDRHWYALLGWLYVTQ